MLCYYAMLCSYQRFFLDKHVFSAREVRSEAAQTELARARRHCGMFRMATAADVASALRMAVPTAVTNFLEFLPSTLVVMMMSRRVSAVQGGLLDLDTVVAGNAYFNTVAMAHGFGVTSPVGTLISQAFGAACPRDAAVALWSSWIALAVGFVFACLACYPHGTSSCGPASRMQWYVWVLVPNYFAYCDPTTLV